MTLEPGPVAEEGEGAPALSDSDIDLDARCEAWVRWCRVNRLYWSPTAISATLTRAGGGTRPLPARVDQSISAASLAAFHVAYTCQPDALDKRVFDLYYIARVKPIKAAAAALGIGRAQYYRVLGDFRRRVDQAARALQQHETTGVQATARGFAVRLRESHDPGGEVNSESVSRKGDKTGP